MMKNDPRILSLQEIREARTRIAGRVHRTALVHSRTLSEEFGCSVSLKLECLQKTGSFKPRGAFNKLLSLAQAERDTGVVGVSGGNHAQGLAYASRELGVRATICMPKTTPANSLDATRGYGANIVLCESIAEAFAESTRLKESGLTEVHPFDDPLIAAGQGTVGLEILEDDPNVTHVFVSIGGGGLIAGVAAALKHQRPDIRILGVETAGADAMAQALAANRIVELPAITSIARTLGAPKVSHMTLHHVQQLVDDVIVVDDAEAVDALEFLFDRTKYATEPASSCCLAAARRRKPTFRPEDRIVILLCGGNVSLADICGWRVRFGRG
jgi:threonine dehydratase